MYYPIQQYYMFPFSVHQGQGYLNKEQCISLLDELNKYR
jgi:hypothetical protein